MTSVHATPVVLKDSKWSIETFKAGVLSWWPHRDGVKKCYSHIFGGCFLLSKKLFGKIACGVKQRLFLVFTVIWK